MVKSLQRLSVMVMLEVEVVVDSGQLSAAGARLSAALRWMRRRHEESPCIRVRCVKGGGVWRLPVLRHRFVIQSLALVRLGRRRTNPVALSWVKSGAAAATTAAAEARSSVRRKRNCPRSCGLFFGFSRQDLVCSCWLARWKIHASEASGLKENIQQEGDSRKQYLA